MPTIAQTPVVVAVARAARTDNRVLIRRIASSGAKVRLVTGLVFVDGSQMPRCAAGCRNRDVALECRVERVSQVTGPEMPAAFSFSGT